MKNDLIRLIIDKTTKIKTIRRVNLILVVIANLGLLALCTALWADKLNVPIPYDTIQAAIDAAVDGDTFIIATTIIIDCQEVARGFYFNPRENESSILDVLTIINAHEYGGIRPGGSVYCGPNCRPTP